MYAEPINLAEVIEALQIGCIIFQKIILVVLRIKLLMLDFVAA